MPFEPGLINGTRAPGWSDQAHQKSGAAKRYIESRYVLRVWRRQCDEVPALL